MKAFAFNRRLVWAVALLALLALLALTVMAGGRAIAVEGATGPFADVVYRNGAFYTVNKAQPWAQAVAIKDGRFLGVGANQAMDGLIGPETQVIELQGRMVMPGLVDTHTHPLMGADKALYQCSFTPVATAEEIAAAVKACAAKGDEGSWIVGGDWGVAIFPNGSPDKAILDAVAPDRPIYLVDETHHHGWANSKALAIAGITAGTPNPEGGEILRDENGEATGALHESATTLVSSLIPPRTPKEQIAAVRWLQNRLNGYGITAIKDAWGIRESLAAFKTVDDAEGLTLRLAAHLAWRFKGRDHGEEQALVADRADYASPRINTSFIKIMLDGVPTTNTSAFIEPYAGETEPMETLFVDRETLKADLVAFDAAGMTVKMHAAGDSSARAALDAVEAARKANGDSGLMHEVGHASFIHDDDMPRFKALGAVAEMSPPFWYPSPVIEHGLVPPLGAERVAKSWPTKSFLKAGAHVVYGSDWPVTEIDPWPALEAMITRRDPLGQTPGVMAPEEIVNLATAIEIFTLNGAHAMRSTSETGSIEEGKLADMIVLDRNLFLIPPDEISETKVMTTLLEGKVVYQRTEQSPE